MMHIVNNFCTDQVFSIFSLLLTLSGFPFSDSIDVGDIVIPSVPCKEDNFVRWTSYANSPVDLLYLISAEEKLFDLVKHYVVKLKHQPSMVFQRYISDYEESSLAAYKGWEGSTNDTEQKYHKIYTNPIQAFRMIRRFVKDFPKIKDALYASGDSEILVKLDKLKEKQIPWPTEIDLNESIDNLLILHEVYELDTRELAKGNISNLLTNVTLSATHCFEIALYAFHNRKQYTHAIEWLEVAVSKRENPTSKHPILDSVEESLLFDLYDEIATEHDKNLISEHPNYLRYMYKYKIDSELSLATLWSSLSKKFRTRGTAEDYITFYDITAFSTLCKGGNLQTDKEKSELYCWYERNAHSFWYINPQKIELHSKKPYIVQVYDFIGNKFIKYLKEQSIPLLERAEGVPEKDIGPDVPDNYEYNGKPRTSMYAFLPEHNNPKLMGLNKKIGALTGLRTHYGVKTQSDKLQIAAYATGGYFTTHIDSLKKTENYSNLLKENIGDRIATFMLYLNDVDHGGRTAFTSAGISVTPVKGSAVFWHIYKRNGKVDYGTWHGGCPVLLGDKWVATKWIYEYPNFLNYKCALHDSE